jgi:hypothetical protein
MCCYYLIAEYCCQNIIYLNTVSFWWMETWKCAQSLRMTSTYWLATLSGMIFDWFFFTFAPEHAHSGLFLYQIVWRSEFQSFEDKSSAINENTGVNERLVEMIMRHHCPGQKMAVGNPEYKRIIEERLVSLSCSFPYFFEQLWSPFLWWLVSAYTMPVWSSCDGVNVGHTEMVTVFRAWRKVTSDWRGPSPLESRTAKFLESLWLWCQTRDGELVQAFYFIASCIYCYSVWWLVCCAF